MVASPVMPVYPPFMYPIPGPVTSLSSPLASGVPLYPCERGGERERVCAMQAP